MQMNYPSEAIGYLCMDDLTYEIFGDTNGWFTDDNDAGWGEDECQGGDLKWLPYTCQEAEGWCRQSGPPQGTTREHDGRPGSAMSAVVELSTLSGNRDTACWTRCPRRRVGSIFVVRTDRLST